MAELLPVEKLANEIIAASREHRKLVVQASTGTGKTTRLPVHLARAHKKKVLVLEPRRVAAIAAASRIAFEQGWDLGGNEVGYQVRLDKKLTEKTQIVFITEALLANRLLEDPCLSDVGLIIFDEFHERNRWSDVGLALALELQALERPDLEIIVLSATLDGMQELVEWPRLEVTSPLYPIEFQSSREPLYFPNHPQFYSRIVNVLRSGPMSLSGDILIFLPGVREINQLQEQVQQQNLSGYQVFALHGGLELHEQKNILSASQVPRIILATNVAESSVTIPGVRSVIDTGLERVATHQPRSGNTILETSRISIASSRQRAGRAGREGPGHVWQLWNEHDQRMMAVTSEPEICRVDLSPMLLWLKCLGVNNPHTFSWLQNPGTEKIETSLRELRNLALIEESGRLTSLGQAVIRVGLGVRASLLVVYALLMASESERDELLDWALVAEGEKNPQQIVKIKRQLQQRVIPLQGLTATTKLQALLSALPDRLALKASDKATSQLASGQTVLTEHLRPEPRPGYFCVLRLAPSNKQDTNLRVEEFVQLEDKAVRDYLASLQLDTVREQVWDSEANWWKVRREKRFYSLRVSANEQAQPWGEWTTAQQLQWIEEHRSQLDPHFFWQAWHFFCQKHGHAMWTNLASVLSFVDPNLSRSADFPWNQLREWLLNAQEGDVQKKWLQGYRSHITLKDNRTLNIQYDPDKKFFVESYLQDFYGLAQLEKIFDCELVVLLNAPNGRCLQTTRNLAQFWQSDSYKEICKEMRSRYPKSQWSDTPLTAPPIRSARRARGD